LGRDLACHGGESFDSLRSLRTPLDSAFRACHERGPKGSTFDQEPENQLQELRRYVEARGWTGQEYVDRGVSGAKDRRPTLDALVSDAKRRKFDVLVCWRLDRLGRNLRPLVTLIEELQTMGIAFISLGEGSTAQRQRASCSCTSLRRWRSSSGRGFRRESRQVSHEPGRKVSALDDPDAESMPNASLPSQACLSARLRDGLGFLGPRFSVGWPENPVKSTADSVRKHWSR